MQNEIYSKCQKNSNQPRRWILFYLQEEYIFLFFISTSNSKFLKTLQSKGRGMGRQNGFWSQTQSRFSGCLIKNKQVLPVSSRDAKSWKEHHAHLYNNSSRSRNNTHTHTQGKTTNSHLFFCPIREIRNDRCQQREEVKTFSYFGQRQLDTAKKNLAKIVNELLKTVVS